jgi:Sulfatase
MKIFKSTSIYLFLLPIFFSLHGALENYEYIYFKEIAKVGVVILIAIVLLYFVLFFFIKDAIHTALITFFISSWVLFFGAIFDMVKSIKLIYFLHSYTVFVPFMFCSIIGFVFFIRKKKILQKKLCYYLNILLLLYCLYDFASLIFIASKTKKQFVSTAINFDTTLIKVKPNVYFLIFDEYPGYKSLKDSFAFANDDLYQFLQSKNFKILPTFSNYNMTFYSMASILNMNYINKPYIALQNTFNDDQDRIKELKNAQVVQYFKSIGYSFTNYSIFDILDQPSVKGNSFVVSQATLLTHKIFFNRMLKDIGWHFITGKNKIAFIENIYMKDKRNNAFIEKQLLETNPVKSSPQFIYAHFNMPHTPFFYDSLGNPLANATIFNESLHGDKSLTLSYLKYANTKIKNLVEVICKKDSNAIIVVMSDHGWRGYKTKGVITPLYFNNICAVRFPNKNYLPMKESWSNVNFFRYLFNAQFNQKIPYLSDSSIFLKDVRVLQ